MGRFALWLLPSLFRFVLVGLAFAAATNIVFGTPEKIKATLNTSGIYSSVVDGVIKESSKKLETGDSIPLDQPEIQKIANDAFSPSYLQESTDQTVDSIYAWLQGKTNQPAFAIDLAGPKQKLADGIGSYAENRLRGLPVCSTAQLRELQGQSIDPFTASCRPANLNIATEKQRLVAEFTNNKDFLGDSTITIDDLTNKGGNNPFTEQLKPVPTVYQWLNRLPWLLGGLAGLLGIGIVFLSPERRRGLRLVAMSLLTTGLFLLVTTLLLWFLFDQVNKPGGRLNQLDSSELQTSLLGVLNTLFAAFNRVLVVVAGSYALLGISSLVALRILKPRNTPAVASTSEPNVLATTPLQSDKEPTPDDPPESKTQE